MALFTDSNKSLTLLDNPLEFELHPVTTGLDFFPSLWSLYMRYRSASCSEDTIFESMILSLCPCDSPLPQIFAQKYTCPFSCFSISITCFLPISSSFLVCSSPILIYSSLDTTQSLDDLSVFSITISLFLILFCSFCSPSFSSSVRFPLTSPFLLHSSFLYPSYVLVLISLLISNIASCFVSKALGRVTLAHSLRSVHLLFLSSNVLVTGSYICLVLASSFSISFSSSSSSSSLSPIPSSSSTFSSSSFFRVILALAYAISPSQANPSVGKFSSTEKFGGSLSIILSFSSSVRSPIISVSYLIMFFSSYFCLSNILSVSNFKSLIDSGILFSLSSSLVLNFFLRCFSLISFFFMVFTLFLPASCLSFLTRFLDLLEFFPNSSSICFLISYLRDSNFEFTFLSSIIFNSIHIFTIFHSGLLAPLSLKFPVTSDRYLLSSSKQKCSTSGKPTSMYPSSTMRWSLASDSPNFFQTSIAILKSMPPFSGSGSLVMVGFSDLSVIATL